MYKLRFNLSKGNNFKKWKLYTEDTILYYEPNDISFMLKNAKLHNSFKTATKIFNGENKSVCSWIECDDIQIVETSEPNPDLELKYNPKIAPYWRNHLDENVDGSTYNYLLTFKNKIYKL